MTLLKTSFLSAISVLVKMLALLGINKILALYVGPVGYAALGQFQNLVQMVTTFSSGAINVGVTKYTAEYHEDEAKQRAVWRSAGTIAVVGTSIMSLLLIGFNNQLAEIFLQDESLSDVFNWFAGSLLLFVFNSLLLAILNGKKEIHLYVVANIVGSLLSIAVTGFMVMHYALYGALVAMAIYQSLAFFSTVILCYRRSWFKLNYLVGKVDVDSAKNLAKFTAMALTTAICVPVSHILIRNLLGEEYGWEYAGYWEAMWRLSAAYLMLVTTTLGIYYLPKLAELTKSADIWREIRQGCCLILPLVFICGVSIYFLRDWIIALLFSKDFSAMGQLFFWQLLGDFLKIASWFFSYLMLSKAMVGKFILLEIFSSALFVYLASVFLEFGDFSYISLAYFVNYLVYLFLVYILVVPSINKGFSN